jgi:hypothetical protein
MKRLLGLLLLSLLLGLALPSKAFSQTPKWNDEQIAERLQQPKTPNTEVQDALRFLAQVNPINRPFIRFFSTYAMPPELRDDAALILSFACHSLIGPGAEGRVVGAYYPIARMEGNGDEENKKIVIYQAVPDSDTLIWVDIRDYGWTPESWEKISEFDGYFAEPVVQYDVGLNIRAVAGNAVVRADWFIVHALNTMMQEDVDKPSIYYELLFSGLEKPKTIEEWRRLWRFDNKEAALVGNEVATLVTKSNAVARHNRILFAHRTAIGYWCETYDVKNTRGFRDYVGTYLQNQNVGGPPDVTDGGEVFNTNSVGMQVYALRDGNNDLVQSGPGVLVRHLTDIYGDARVRVADSCIDCHAEGPLVAENTIEEFLQNGAQILVDDHSKFIRLKRNFLDGRFNEQIIEYQKYFAASLLKVNGLTPAENIKAYKMITTWYTSPLDERQVLVECGTEKENLLRAIAQKPYGARLKLLLTTGERIPREVWESPSTDGIPGAFQEAMMAIYGIAMPTVQQQQQQQQQAEKENPPLPVDLPPKFQVKRMSSVRAGSNIVGTLNKGDIIELSEKPELLNGKEWVKVTLENGSTGYIEMTNLEQIDE